MAAADDGHVDGAEEIGVERRGKFYDATGVVRDVVQNHLLQLLTLESSAPASASPNSPASSSSESSGDDEDALGTLAGHPDRRDSAVEAGGGAPPPRSSRPVAHRRP